MGNSGDDLLAIYGALPRVYSNSAGRTERTATETTVNAHRKLAWYATKIDSRGIETRIGRFETRAAAMVAARASGGAHVHQISYIGSEVYVNVEYISA